MSEIALFGSANERALFGVNLETALFGPGESNNMKVQFNINNVGGNAVNWNNTTSAIPALGPIIPAGSVIDDTGAVVAGMQLNLLTAPDTSFAGSNVKTGWPHTIVQGSGTPPIGEDVSDTDFPNPEATEGYWVDTGSGWSLRLIGLVNGRSYTVRCYCIRDSSAARTSVIGLVSGGNNVAMGSVAYSPILASTAVASGREQSAIIVADGTTMDITISAGASPAISAMILEWVEAGPPKLTTSYSNLFNSVGDSGTVDLGLNLSGESAVFIEGLPKGATYNNNTGLITFDLTHNEQAKITVSPKNSSGELLPNPTFFWYVGPQARMFNKLAQYGTNGNWYSFTETDLTLAELDNAFFSNQYATSVLSTDDVLTLTGSDGTKIVRVAAVNTEARTITLSSGLTIV